MGLEETLLAVERGSVTAPAGCGKTHLIAEALRLHAGKLPVLVLTHTNAGVTALRQRFSRLGVNAKSYRLSTIDALSKRLAAMFLTRSELDPRALEIANPAKDYPAIQLAAIRLLEGRHLDDSLAATYARLVVDEYQDCVIGQHKVVTELARALPTCVLGDPMQAIFGFTGKLVSWQKDVESNFPSLGTMDTPWRWINAEALDLGEWLLQARAILSRGENVDVRTLPARVEYVAAGPEQHDLRRRAAMTAAIRGGTVLLLGDAKNVSARHLMASQIPGATVVERVDLGDLTNFAKAFNPAAPRAAEEILEFAGSLMTGLDVANTSKRLESIRSNKAIKPPTEIELALLRLEDDKTFHAAQAAMETMRSAADVRLFRHEVFHRCVRSLAAASDGTTTFGEASIQERERFRLKGRALGRRNMGSTLLLKGLEADTAVILHADAMDARNLYVALTRASHRVVVCASTPILPMK
jgi:DNA helicase-2/ATP-dependent DNA helicase PcrA